MAPNAPPPRDHEAGPCEENAVRRSCGEHQGGGEDSSWGNVAEPGVRLRPGGHKGNPERVEQIPDRGAWASDAPGKGDGTLQGTRRPFREAGKEVGRPRRLHRPALEGRPARRA